jgi:hypothetical protein
MCSKDLGDLVRQGLRSQFATNESRVGRREHLVADAPTRRRAGVGRAWGVHLRAHAEHRTWARDRRVDHAGLPGFRGPRARGGSGDLRRDRSPGGVIVASLAPLASLRDRESAIRQDPVHGRIARPPSSHWARRRQRRQALQDQRGLHPRPGGLLWLHRGRRGPGRGQEARGRLRARPPQPLRRDPVRRGDVPAPELPAARGLRGRGLPPRGSASAAGEDSRSSPRARAPRSSVEMTRVRLPAT